MPIVPTTSETNKEGLLAHLSLGGKGQLGQQWKTVTEKKEKKDRKEGEKEEKEIMAFENTAYHQIWSLQCICLMSNCKQVYRICVT